VRILHIISQHPASTGSGIYLQNIIRRAAAAGHQNFLIAGQSGNRKPTLDNIDSCLQQTAVSLPAALQANGQKLTIDLHRVPDDVFCRGNPFFLKIQGHLSVSLQCEGARIVSCKQEQPNLQTFSILPGRGQKEIVISAR
jgi:hypothetical protein